jgi:hypothetical protein
LRYWGVKRSTARDYQLVFTYNEYRGEIEMRDTIPYL